MSWNPAIEPGCPLDTRIDSIETLIIPRARDVAGFEVRRALPAPKRQMVGPFIFFDQMGPVEFVTNQGVDVRPHPHIGLGTVTYLFKGMFQHRDSVGSNQAIYPGDVNWMIAGRGVTHSERTDEETRKHPHALLGIQTWVALPEAYEEVEADFEHRGKHELPVLESEGAFVRLMLGSAWGEKTNIRTFSEMFYADAHLQPGTMLPLPDDHEDRGIYIVEGSVYVAGTLFESGRMMVFRPGDPITILAGEQGARLVLLGGETLSGPRYIWWNFVSSSRDRIEEAKEAWKRGDFHHGQFRLPPDDDEEFVPLPEIRRENR